MGAKEGKPNRLIHEKSPYLLQHAYNPVDWHPWKGEAFEKARRKGKPIFLSIGYATCHWCHVMAHESFEDRDVARLLNKSFISIKVDREERPDIDQIYMSVCQSMTGHGGWPLSIFMTPGGDPFYAGTYFPKTGRLGMPGFVDLLKRIAGHWENEKEREKLLRAGEEIRQAIRKGISYPEGVPVPGPEILKKACQQLSQSFDPEWGGFSPAPKFPMPHQLTFLLRWHRRSGEEAARQMVEKTLDGMRRGGVFDQIGFGFHRYAVDEKWRVPHFEKMLYDQGLTALAYTEAFQALGEDRFAETARAVFTYVLRDLTAPEGAFYAAEDADTEGMEGRFYVWTPKEVKSSLPADLADLFCRFYGITEGGNFEGFSIPHVALSLERLAELEKTEPVELTSRLESAREKLFQVRRSRVRPLRDDKILAGWNGLMIAALAKGYSALGDPDYARAARQAADFILERMRTPSGGLFRRYRDGELAFPGFLEDYAFLVWGLLELYEAVLEIEYFKEALRLNRMMIDQFWDEKGGFYFTPRDHEPLIVRPKDLHDGALPSGNSVAAGTLLRLSRMTGDIDLEKLADRQLKAFSFPVSANPMAYIQFLNALDFMLGPAQEIVIAGEPEEEATREMIRIVQRPFLPNKVLLLRPGGEAGQALSALSPYLGTLHALDRQTTVFICEQYACRNPLTDAAALRRALQSRPGVSREEG
ncbi:MAG: thioredoxin domain-containing protein [Deltaproteobacteria bacterium]|nr:thioredoxin domain-containing protein [Deltaproteobacteria bacterium]